MWPSGGKGGLKTEEEEKGDDDDGEVLL